MLFALNPKIFAQEGKYIINGTVVDDASNPMIGCVVIEQGTNNGTSTDINGQFLLKVTDDEAKLDFSFIGYTTQTFLASSPEVKNVVMVANLQNVDDVIVIGYGTVKKDDMTGSVSAVKADQLNKGLISSPSNMLIGKSAGVVVTQGNGQPGSASTIRIRGGSSLSASNDPLFIIDGLPISNIGIHGVSDPLSSINPSDIESFTILKDASATAIYGSRASNGVIIITTKKGSKYDSATPTVNVDFTTSICKNNKYVDVMDADQIRGAITDLYPADKYPNAIKSLGDSNTDWQSLIYQTAMSYDVNIGITGNAKFGNVGYMPYRISGGYLNQNGVLKTSNMDRTTMSVNLNPILFDDHLNINLNAKFMDINNTFANQGAIGAAVGYDPTQPVYDETESGLLGYKVWRKSTTDGSVGDYNTVAGENPMALLYNKTDESDAKRFIGNSQIDYKIHGFEDLRLNLNLGMDYTTSEGEEIVLPGSEMSYRAIEVGAGSHRNFNQEKMDLTLESHLAYNKEIGRHSVNAVAGYSWQHFYEEGFSRKVRIEGDGSQIGSAVPWETQYFLVSFFGRVNYSFANKYLLTATVRRDGTSRFINNQWGLFPSIGVAWNIMNEDFLKDSNVVSTAKLRASWGKTGQQEINAGNYPSLATYNYNTAGSFYQFGYDANGNPNIIAPITPFGYNADLKWETTETYNIALDYGFLNGRIYGSLDYYQRETTDMINYTTVPAGSNLKNYLVANVGSLEGKGVEFEINAVAVQTKDINWTVGFNTAWNENVITKLTLTDNNPDSKGQTVGSLQINQVGYPINTFFVYKQVYDETSGKPIEGAYIDMNDDGMINQDDKYYGEKPAPDFTFGLNTSFTYKNLTIAASGHGSAGNYVYNNTRANREVLSGLYSNENIANRASTALTTGFKDKAQPYSDMYVEDASFFKLDNVTASYQLNDVWKDMSFTVYGTVQNVATITKYDGLDPEVFNGIGGDMYPRSRTYIIGLKFNF